MRFAPPKSAPPGSRKTAKDTENEDLWSSVLSGWSIKNEHHDVSLLNECINNVPKRCNSATDRYSSSEALVINFRRQRTRQPISPVTRKDDSIRSQSKDSGVDGMTDSGVGSMDSATKYLNAEDEFSDISNSDSLLSEEEDVAFSSTEDAAPVVMSVTISSNNLLLKDSFISPRDMAVNRSITSSRNTAGDSASSSNLVGYESSESIAGIHSSENVLKDDSSCVLEVPTASSRNQGVSQPNLGIRTSLENNAFKPRNKRESRREVLREHKVPTSISPVKPEVSTPPRQQPWSRTKKLERHSTTPSMCSYTDMVYDGTVKKESNPESYLPNPFEYLLPANRPRPEKRRSSLGVKSSCSIPSFSTPSQALLLIGMQPDRPAQSLPKAKKSAHSKPPLIRRSKETTSFELPALSVNGAGDLVIRKKHIVSG